MKSRTLDDLIRSESSRYLAANLKALDTLSDIPRHVRVLLPDYLFTIHLDGKRVFHQFLTPLTTRCHGKARVYTSESIEHKPTDIYLSYVRPKDFINLINKSYANCGIRKDMSKFWKNHSDNHSNQWVITVGGPFQKFHSIESFIQRLVAYCPVKANHPPEGDTRKVWFNANTCVVPFCRSDVMAINAEIVCTLKRINR